MDRLLRAREVAAATGLPRSTVYRLAQSGELPCVKFAAKSVRFPERAISQWIERQLAATERGGQTVDGRAA